MFGKQYNDIVVAMTIRECESRICSGRPTITHGLIVMYKTFSRGRSNAPCRYVNTKYYMHVYRTHAMCVLDVRGHETQTEHRYRQIEMLDLMHMILENKT